MKAANSSKQAFSLLEVLTAVAIGAIVFTTCIQFTLIAINEQSQRWILIEEQKVAERVGRLFTDDIGRSPFRRRIIKELSPLPPWTIQAWDYEIQYAYRTGKDGLVMYRKTGEKENQLLPKGWTASMEISNGQVVVLWATPEGIIYKTHIFHR